MGYIDYVVVLMNHVVVYRFSGGVVTFFRTGLKVYSGRWQRISPEDVAEGRSSKKRRLAIALWFVAFEHFSVYSFFCLLISTKKGFFKAILKESDETSNKIYSMVPIVVLARWLFRSAICRGE